MTGLPHCFTGGKPVTLWLCGRGGVAFFGDMLYICEYINLYLILNNAKIAANNIIVILVAVFRHGAAHGRCQDICKH